MLQCRQVMLASRRDFSGGIRVYVCEVTKVSCAVDGPGTDEETVELTCEECCKMKMP